MARRKKRQGFIVGVSQLKGDFYAWLDKTDPADRGYCAFAAGLGDEYYRQVTAEVRVLKRASSGVMTSRWVISEAGRRNEALDTMLMAEAGARFKHWTYMSDAAWDQLDAERGGGPEETQGDLFAAAVPVVAELPQPLSAQAMPEEPAPALPRGGKPRPEQKPTTADADPGWVPDREDWL